MIALRTPSDSSTTMRSINLFGPRHMRRSAASPRAGCLPSPLIITMLAATWLCGCAPGAPGAPSTCTPPRGGWLPRSNGSGSEPPLRTVIALRRSGALYWNETPVRQSQLNSYLAISHTLNPEPDVLLEVETGAPCAVLTRVRNAMDRNLECRASGRCAETEMRVHHADAPVVP